MQQNKKIQVEGRFSASTDTAIHFFKWFLMLPFKQKVSGMRVQEGCVCLPHRWKVIWYLSKKISLKWHAFSCTITQSNPFFISVSVMCSLALLCLFTFSYVLCYGSLWFWKWSCFKDSICSILHKRANDETKTYFFFLLFRKSKTKKTERNREDMEHRL